MADFFISYHHESRAFAEKLKTRIEGRGFPAWMDTSLVSGDEWKKLIDNAIEGCIAVIVVVTVQALNSRYVTYEWSYALGKDKRVIPVIYDVLDETIKEHALHPKLIDRQFGGDFTNPDKNEWDKFLGQLELIHAQLHVPDEVSQTVRLLANSDPKVRTDAINMLRDYEHPQALEALAKAVDSLLPDVSRLAALALAEKSQYTDERALPGLAKGARYHSTLEKSIHALKRMDSAGAVECMMVAFREVPINTSLGMEVIKALSDMSHPHVVPALKEILKMERGLQLQVIDALGRLQNPDALPELLKIMQLPQADKAKEHTVRALGKINHPGILETMYEILSGFPSLYYAEEYNIFRAAIEVIVTHGGQAALETLQNLSNVRVLKTNQGMTIIQKAVNQVNQDIKSS